MKRTKEPARFGVLDPSTRRVIRFLIFIFQHDHDVTTANKKDFGYPRFPQVRVLVRVLFYGLDIRVFLWRGVWLGSSLFSTGNRFVLGGGRGAHGR